MTAQLGQGFILSSDAEQVFGSENVGDVFNPMGLANPAIDALIRKDRGHHARGHGYRDPRAGPQPARARFWVPQWYKADHTVAYYDIFAHPDKILPMRWVSLISGGMTRIRRQN